MRSVGLGCDLIRPMSWVVDGRGIYYDATRPSDLEHLLVNTSIRTDDIGSRRLVAGTHCCRGSHQVQRWYFRVATSLWCGKSYFGAGSGRDDASLVYGAPKIRSNMGLLRAVRQANPDAYIVYKPHPDVMAGLRARGAGEENALNWCDEQVTDAIMGDLLMAVDEVHVLTSIAGFEALLRGKPVTCYGQPFYSGWGLTVDIEPNSAKDQTLIA